MNSPNFNEGVTAKIINDFSTDQYLLRVTKRENGRKYYAKANIEWIEAHEGEYVGIVLSADHINTEHLEPNSKLYGELEMLKKISERDFELLKRTIDRLLPTREA